MRIERIVLDNFGSYEGENIFNTHTDSRKNILLIGGKNGAGKTTLFTAIRLCLYGFMSMGYRNQNSYYTRAITKLINNNAKIIRPSNAYVELILFINNGRGLDEYTLRRSWVLDDSLTESFFVRKNNNLLSAEETGDFEKYILSLIPPELFNLYFFDGEKIADFFLEEGSNARIKDAFLTLCGYDTFEIMRKNFKRFSHSSKNTTPSLSEYIIAKENYENGTAELSSLSMQLQSCSEQLSYCDAEIELLDKNYYKNGGITEEEWNQKLFILKEEEKKRETYNTLLKKWATEIIPFIMIKDQIEEVKSQIQKENSHQKYNGFCDIIECPDIQEYIVDKKQLKEIVFMLYGSQDETILDLSFEQSAHLLALIEQLLSFDSDKVIRCKKSLKRSLALTAKTRTELDNSSTSTVQEYMKRRASLFEEKSLLLVQRSEIEQQIFVLKENLQQLESAFSRSQEKLEYELKNASISDIAARSIIMLDKLQKRLYQKQIRKVEDYFRKEIKLLMRKTHFIDDILIDDDFGIHIFKTDSIDSKKIITLLKSESYDDIAEVLGKPALETLLKQCKATSTDDIVTYINLNKIATFELPIEIDKTSLSNGEKQIFIMALYYSLIQLCSNEIPFIIDTPFARIDTEHRINISKHFFSKLNGQVFILSTNEEIDSNHVSILNGKIASTFMLENPDNQKTRVEQNSYFEVK